MSEDTGLPSSVRTCAVRAAFTLHARPAARLVQGLQDFDAELAVIRGQVRADAGSILDLLALSIQEGDWLTLEAGGADADAALEALAAMLASEME